MLWGVRCSLEKDRGKTWKWDWALVSSSLRKPCPHSQSAVAGQLAQAREDIATWGSLISISCFCLWKQSRAGGRVPGRWLCRCDITTLKKSWLLVCFFKSGCAHFSTDLVFWYFHSIYIAPGFIIQKDMTLSPSLCGTLSFLFCTYSFPSLSAVCLFSSRHHKLASFKYLSDSIEPYDAGPVTGLSPSVVKRKNAGLCYNRLNTAPGKIDEACQL